MYIKEECGMTKEEYLKLIMEVVGQIDDEEKLELILQFSLGVKGDA